MPSASSKSGELFGVFVQRSVGDKIEIAMAERAVQRGAGQPEQMFVLYDGRRYEGVPGTPNWRIVEFREHGIPVRLPDAKAGKSKIEMKTHGHAAGVGRAEGPGRAGLAHGGAGHGAGADGAGRAARHACGRGRGALRASAYAVLVYFLYSNLLAAVRVWIQKDSPGGQLGLWWVHLMPLAVRRVAALARTASRQAVAPALAASSGQRRGGG